MIVVIIREVRKLWTDISEARTRREAARKALDAKKPEDQEHRRRVLELPYKQQTDEPPPAIEAQGRIGR